MVPLAWHCLLKQAERPDQAAFFWYRPGGPPSLRGGESRGSLALGGQGPPPPPP